MRYAYLGVQSVPLYPQLVERFDLPVKRGAWLQEVVQSDGPAETAGLQGGKGERPLPGPLVLRRAATSSPRIEDRPIRDADDLSEAVQLFDPGAEGDARGRGATARSARSSVDARPAAADGEPEPAG